ncbi:ABC transporter permease [Candidatus Woesearchaeota archaeon]|nr:ABC transporter permease [Candidatus Woesearchaeota archaeon]
MKIEKLVKKDLKLFSRDTKTLTLIIIAPVIILVILGNVFGQTTSAKSLAGLKLGLCNLDEEYKEISIPLFTIEDLGKECQEKAEDLVNEGKIRASLFIPKNFTKNIREGYGSEIILYVDNSKTQTAVMASESIKALVQKLNEDIGTDFIRGAWDKLSDLNKKLKFVVKEAEYTKNQTIDIQEKVANLQNNLKNISTEGIEKQVIEINKSLGELSNTQINITPEINNITKSLKEIHNTNCQGNISQDQCLTINSTINKLDIINENIADKENKINLVLKKIDSTQLNATAVKINETKTTINKELKNINETFFNYTNNLIEIVDELNATTQLLDTYTSRDPKNIVRAVTLNEEKVFGERTYFEFLAPGIILVLLLFTIILVSSSNIVNERKTGTLARTLLSPTSIPTFLLSKIIFFTIICFIEIIVMIIVTRLFGVKIPINLQIILIFLVSSINFIVIGLILGSLSNSENAALLSSLVIALPMFFLSNLFFPFEIMPKFMKSVGSNLPLTLSINNIDKIITYSTSIELSEVLKLIIIFIVLSILTHLIIKRKPTAD